MSVGPARRRLGCEAASSVRRASSLAVLALTLAVAPAQAHRSPGSTSTLAWNARAGVTEITHRLHVHDAITGIAPFAGVARLNATELVDRARIALYVEERFFLSLADEAVALRTLGAELRDDYVLVYQETDVRLDERAPDTPLRVRSDIL
ncbi:MAG: DUF6702 family protein, partial [Pseudomonadota bacterium]